jgi:hypothetical protein
MLMKIRTSLLAIAALSAGLVTASATPLGLGQNTAGPANANFFGGTLLASLSTPVATPTFTGTARSAVYQNAAGLLDFYYQFSSNGPDDIGRLSFFNFDNFTTDVYNIVDGSLIGAGFINGTVDSDQADRGVNPLTNSVGFDYQAGAFTPGTTSLALVIRTNATAYTAGTFSVIDGSTSTTASFAPTAAGVPDNANSVLLLASGLLGLAAIGRHLRKIA